ncbi:MAG TPA: Gfo/Idh/MocA family oxidoreductase [Bacteroidota bacterium]
MEPVRLGIIGVGWVAQVIHFPILIKLPDVKIVSLSDVNKSRAHLVGEKYGIKNIYSDVHAMLQSVDISAVLICTPTDTHLDLVLACLAAGKDVLVEKPIARSYKEAVQMADAARDAKRNLMVGMNLRFRPDTMLLKSFIEGKELGNIFYASIGWLTKRQSDSKWAMKKEKAGGGVFMDIGNVLLDMALWMMGYPNVTRVKANHFKQKAKQVEDTSLVTLTLSNGAVIRIESSWSLCLQDEIYYGHFYGPEGTASLNPLRIHRERYGNVVNLAPAKMDSPQAMFKRSYENELKHFLAAVQGIHPLISTADEAIHRMRIVEAVYKSARLGKEIVIT